MDKPPRIPTVFDVLSAALAPRLAVGTTAKQVAKRFQEGDIVTHPAFGRGAVVKSTVTKTDEELVIRFDTTGIKILSGRLAPLTKSAIIEPLDAPL